MDLNKYSSNSKTRVSPRDCLTTPTKQSEKVIKGGVRTKKPTVADRLAKEIKGDDTRTVGTYLLETVVIPRGKDLLGDIVHNGFKVLQDTVEVAIFGEVKSSRTKVGSRWRSNYKEYYDNNRTNSNRAKQSSKGYEELLLESRDEANEVLNRLLDRIDEYGCVSVADLYEMVGLSATYQDRKFGWDRLATAEVIKVGREYLLDLPRPKTLD